MGTREAIVLAAGAGRRLGGHTDAVPKVLVPVAGRPMVLRLLGQLAEAGVAHAIVVVGAFAEQVRDAIRGADLGLEVAFVENTAYATTNNSHSLALCGEALARGVALFEGDTVTSTDTIRALLEAPAGRSFWAVRRDTPERDGCFLEADPGGRLCRLRIVRPGEDRGPGAKSMGMLRLTADYGARLAGWLRREGEAGRRDRYYDLVIADHLDEAPLELLHLEDGFWIEVDTPEDLARAEAGLRGAS